MAAVGDPGIRAVEKSDKNNSPIATDLCFAFQTFVWTWRRRDCHLDGT